MVEEMVGHVSVREQVMEQWQLKLAHDFLGARNVMIAKRFAHAFEKTFKKNCHDGHEVIAYGKSVASKETFKKCLFLRLVENDIFGGQFVS